MTTPQWTYDPSIDTGMGFHSKKKQGGSNSLTINTEKHMWISLNICEFEQWKTKVDKQVTGCYRMVPRQFSVRWLN